MVLSQIAEFSGSREANSEESKECARICQQLTRFETDVNVSSFDLKYPLGEKDICRLLLSRCPQVIDTACLLLCFQNHIAIDPLSDYGVALSLLHMHPEAWHAIMEYEGWTVQSHTEDILERVRFRRKYHQHPRKSQRRRGYNDKGSLTSSSVKARRAAIQAFYEEAYQRRLEVLQYYLDRLHRAGLLLDLGSLSDEEYLPEFLP